MKTTIINTVAACLLCIPILVFAQANDTDSSVDLQWKLKPGDTLTYETVLTEIEASSIDIDFGGLFDQIVDSTDVENKDIGKTLFKQLKNLQANTNLVTRLTSSENVAEVINIETIAIPKEENEHSDEDGISPMMNAMMRGTMLRGSVYKSGNVHSFWVKSSQKNLISLFFELPTRAISIGDSWELKNVNLIANDQNFICKEAQRKNKVTFTELKIVDGETIAVIEYDVLEYVSGDFSTPAIFGNEKGNQKTTMKFIYKAQGEFSVDQGKWVIYNGIMSLDATGALNTTQKQKFALVEK